MKLIRPEQVLFQNIEIDGGLIASKWLGGWDFLSLEGKVICIRTFLSTSKKERKKTGKPGSL